MSYNQHSSVTNAVDANGFQKKSKQLQSVPDLDGRVGEDAIGGISMESPTKRVNNHHNSSSNLPSPRTCNAQVTKHSSDENNQDNLKSENHQHNTTIYVMTPVDGNNNHNNNNCQMIQQTIENHQDQTQQSYVPPSPAHQRQHQPVSTTTSASITNPDTRTHVVGELYDTERSYVESLQILTEKYMKPLKSLDSNKTLIDSNLVDEIFYTIPEILEHHENFLSALQDRLSSDWDSSQIIGNVFIEAIIDTYTAFINNWKNARQAIKVAIQAKPAFERFLEAMSREHRNKLTLDALLIMPVQRIPRYELLIKELIKHTQEDHPDYGPLIEAQKEIHELALKIDRAEKEMIHQEQLKDLESLIEGHVELQHPQRDFIRYDLVTISASTLTVAKKERVLFLFCDLLIMTSVKKKVSRRSNLQAAFANSHNDLSLLEGNKFKLLLRISLDQIEIRHEGDQNQLLQSQQQRQQQLNLLAQQKKYAEDRRREIEADSFILRQMETLSSRFAHSDRTRLDAALDEISGQLKDKLANLEKQCEPSLLPQLPAGQSDLYIIQNSNPALISPSNSSQANVSETMANAISTNSSVAQQAQNAANQLQQLQQDTSPSLEFIISNMSPIKESSLTNAIQNISSITSDSMSSDLVNHNSAGLSNPSDGQLFSQHQQATNNETLVVTFPSIERRQAFLQAFLEAKQHRLKLQHQRQQQFQQRMFSSSITLKLSEPGSPCKRDTRRTRLRHQDEVIENPPKSSSCIDNDNRHPSEMTTRIASAPYGTGSTCTIVHQMSAPHSLGEVGPSLSTSDITANGKKTSMSNSQCVSCSVDHRQDAGKRHTNNDNNNNHHHHHQLIHQPASHPALLSTFCCSDQHNDFNASGGNRGDGTTTSNMGSSHHPDKLCNLDESPCDIIEQQRSTEYHIHAFDQSSPGGLLEASENSLLTLSDDFERCNIVDKSQPFINSFGCPFRFNPKFVLSLPTTFLNTQHPALQFTTSAIRKGATSRPIVGDSARCGSQMMLADSRSQTIGDSSGQLWLCMSNGYVSHVALISLRRQKIPNAGDNKSNDDFYTITPFTHSAGDICKAHINCAAQVKGTKRFKFTRSRPTNALTSGNEPHQTRQPNHEEVDKQVAKEEHRQSFTERKPTVELTIKSASPPVDIITRTVRELDHDEPVQLRQRLSESAPSTSLCDNAGQENSNEPRRTRPSASANRLDVTSIGGNATRLDGVAGIDSSRSGNNNTSKHLQRHSSTGCTGSSSTSSSLCSTREQRANGGQLPRRAICRRYYHYSCDHLRNRMRTCSPGPVHSLHLNHHHRNQSSPQSAIINDHQRNLHHSYHGHHHLHHHNHHQHSHQHGHHYLNHNHPHHHHHHHHHHPQHHHHHHFQYNDNHNHHEQHQHQHHHSQSVNLYNSRHHTVPLAELRKALERQHRISGHYRNHTGQGHGRHHLAPPANTPNRLQLGSLDRTDSSKPDCDGSRSLREKKARSSTPPARFDGSKSLRSARLLRHQASLKTSSILAKLVSGASRGSSYLRKSNNNNNNQDKQQTSDVDDNDTDTDSGKNTRPKFDTDNNNDNERHEDSVTGRNSIVGLTVPGAHTANSGLNLSNPNVNNSVVSPLSSVSSLNSNNSSITVNSACGSSLNRSSCSILDEQWASTTCCIHNPNELAHPRAHVGYQQHRVCSQTSEGCTGIRGRSATVPCRAFCQQPQQRPGRDRDCRPEDNQYVTDLFAKCSNIDLNRASKTHTSLLDDQDHHLGAPYKVSDILPDSNVDGSHEYARHYDGDQVEVEEEYETSSLWLGCDDGSLIMIDCLGGNPTAEADIPPAERTADCDICDLGQNQNGICRNVHAEIKFNSPICDIKVHKDRRVFVALANGQLAVFSSRQRTIDADHDVESAVADSQGHDTRIGGVHSGLDQTCPAHDGHDDHGWRLSEPQIVTLATNDINSSSKLCLIDDNHLWYSYGRSIFVLDIETLNVLTTIMTPTNDKSIQFSIQSITIEHMELVSNLNGVWVSFKSSPLIQFYDTNNYKLLLEISLLHPINKILSYGNEIIRQHKTACLRATSLLNVYNESDNTNSLFVGTSAGIIIYLSIHANQLRDHNVEPTKRGVWNLQVISLRHGHTGQVKVLHLLELEEDEGIVNNRARGESNNDSSMGVEANCNVAGDTTTTNCTRKRHCLVSVGPGVDLYGPDNEQQIIQHLNNDEDCTNHLLLWQL